MAANYSFIVDNHYQPFSMQEMLTPFMMYKDAFEKAEDTYVDLATKADKFKYLSTSLPEDSKARQIYEGYANELAAQAQDLAQNGLNPINRSALTSLRRRYSGEIGMLDEAQKRFEEAQKTRNAAMAQGLPMLYNTDNLSIDNFLGESQPNLFGINSNELYTRGATIGKQLSSREFSFGEGDSVLGNLYKDLVQTQGIKNVGAFMQSGELQNYIDQVLYERIGNNLTGESYARARKALENGIYEGIMYSETHRPERDYNVPTWSERQQNALSRAQFELARAEHAMKAQDWIDQRNLTYEFDKDGNVIGYKPTSTPTGYERDPLTGKLVKTAGSGKGNGSKSGSSGGSGSGGSTQHYSINKKGIRVSWKGNNPKDLNGDADNDIDINEIDDSETERIGLPYDYDDLPQYAKDKVDKIINIDGDGNPNYYQYYFKPFKRGALWGALNDREAELEIIPRGDFTSNRDEIIEDYGQN